MKKGSEEPKKEKLFARICGMEKENKKILPSVKAMKNKLEINGNLNNIAHTAIEKIVGYIEPQFENAGLSFYSNSIVSKSISNQIEGYVNKGYEMLSAYNQSIKSDAKLKGTLRIVTPFNKLIAKIRKRFISKKNSIAPESMETARQYIDKYMSLDKELSEYNLHDAIVSAIIQTICPDDNFIYLDDIVPILMRREIEPELIQLGLKDVIPTLNQCINARYRKVRQDEQYRNMSNQRMPNLDEIESEELLNGFEPEDD